VPISLPGCGAGSLTLGSHTAILTVFDGVNAGVSQSLPIDIVDTSVPTLAPAGTPAILWPPNHQLVDVVISANASDNGGHVDLSATVSSNEPQDGLGDGDTALDWTAPVIDQSSGKITLKLRAERSGRGTGRTYSVSVTARDLSNNESHATVDIKVPVNQSKK
jgi:hypothetical protein